MIWIIIAPALALALVAVAGFARAAARARTAPQPSHTTIPAGDIGHASLACQPGWEPAYILDAHVAGGMLIIRTAGSNGAQTGLVIPAAAPQALYAFARLLALDDASLDPAAIASSITASRAGTVIAIRTAPEALS